MARTVVNVTASSTLDGRDISADGTKLDGIEANATADQTAAEIKSLVEASSDIALAGNPTTTTQSSGNSSTRIATTAFVADATSGLATDSNLNSKAPIASPTFTGTVTIPTADVNGGNIDGTTIGSTTAAAGTFTTFTSTGIDDNASSTAITIDSSENVGIGTTSPADELHVNATSANINMRLTRDTNTGARISGSEGASTPVIKFDTIASGTATERMRITSAGSVGIGTTSPAYKLDVNGQINGTSVSAGGVSLASTGKAIAMAIVFGG